MPWRSWSREAFVEAAAARRPVLLSVGASWCRWSAEMQRTTYADPMVRDLVAQRFIPIWVDADRRPDVNERYNLGGWPTTVFLTCDGQVLGGETYVRPERMLQLLRKVAAADPNVPAGTPAPDVPEPARPPSTAAVEPDVAAAAADFVTAFEHHLLQEFDHEHAGFGTEAKRVHASALRFGLRRLAGGHDALREVVTRTLDAVGWRDLYDDVDGGVFRYCEGRDWTVPHVEKLAEVNAAVLEAFLDGWVVLGEERYRERAVDVIRYVHTSLLDRDGHGFFASQFADDDYYDADPADRLQRPPPAVDRSIYTDSTARMAKAFVQAAGVLDDSSLLACAVTALEDVVAATYERGGGIAHAAADVASTRGFLRDQVTASDALIDAYLATDRDVYLDLAQELMRVTLRTLWSDEAGGFRDRVTRTDDVGLLRDPLFPFEANCLAAAVLARLGHLAGDDTLLDRAALILTTQLPQASMRGVEAAPWPLAALELGR